MKSSVMISAQIVAAVGGRVLGSALRGVGPLQSHPRRAAVIGWVLCVAASASAQVVTESLVKDIHPGILSQAGTGSSPELLASKDGVTYFRAVRADVGSELWRTDGTVAGTRLVIDLFPGPQGSGPSSMTELPDGRFVFAAFSVDRHRERMAIELTGTRCSVGVEVSVSRVRLHAWP